MGWILLLFSCTALADSCGVCDDNLVARFSHQPACVAAAVSTAALASGGVECLSLDQAEPGDQDPGVAQQPAVPDRD